MLLNESERNALMQDYFDGIDNGEADRLRNALAPDITYNHLDGTFEGIEAVVTRMVDERTPQDAVHEVHRRVHEEEVSVYEGAKTGEVQGESVHLPFCDVVEFDDEEAKITQISIYIRDV